MSSREALGGLACCHGYEVAAGRLLVGLVETPVFAANSIRPDHLIVRTTDGAFRVAPAALVLSVDVERRVVVFDADGDAISALPERLPFTTP